MRILCRKCSGELNAIMEQCWVVQDCPTCGAGHGFIAGTKGLKIEGDNITCTCHDPKLELIFHMNMKPRHVYRYKCETCNNQIDIG